MGAVESLVGFQRMEDKSQNMVNNKEPEIEICYHLFDILSHNQRMILWSDEAHQTIYSWDHHTHLEAWESMGELWRSVATFNMEGVPQSVGEALYQAQDWHHHRSNHKNSQAPTLYPPIPQE
jgi:hypothetical protein